MPNLSNEYNTLGYTIVRQLYSQDEIDGLLLHYMKLHFDQQAVAPERNSKEIDPLKIYPRILQPHRYDATSRQALLNPKIRAILVDLWGQAPYAASSMFYFKPPKARGQALHQDQYYILSEPEPCIAVWIAMEDCDEENGCLRVVPGSHTLPVLGTVAADTTKSFKNVKVPLPEGMTEVPVTLKAGDALIFQGHVLHGSLPNTSATRFRRALILHYIQGDSTGVAEFFNPVVHFDGTEINLRTSVGPRDDVDL